MKEEFRDVGTRLANTLESGAVVDAGQLQASLDTFAFMASQVGDEEVARSAALIETIQHHAQQQGSLVVPPLPVPGQGQMG